MRALIEEKDINGKDLFQWLRAFKGSLLALGISGILAVGCADPFDPFEETFPCLEDEDCVRGFRCSEENICVVGEPLPDLQDAAGSEVLDTEDGDAEDGISEVESSCLEEELCNGEDDDCDGAVDEAFPELGSACVQEEANPCDDGLWVCSEDGSALECDFDPGDWVEICESASGFSWAPLVSQDPAFQPQESYSLACAADRAFIFSGAESTAEVAEATGLFIFSEQQDGTWAWTELGGDSAPAGRVRAAAEYLPEEEKLLLFGGNGFGPVYGDTWTWSSAEGWVEEAPALSPSPRTGHDLVYIPDNKSVLLFGGHPQNCDGDFGDTWTWNQGEWLELSLSSAPTARHQHRMAWDAAHGYVLMFGGREGCGEFSRETWAFDGAEWYELTPERAEDSPPVTSRGAMGYDPKLGGVIYVAEDADKVGTWVWSGSLWFRLAPAQSPGAYSDPHMCYLDEAGASVLVSARDGASETWLWSAPTSD